MRRPRIWILLAAALPLLLAAGLVAGVLLLTPREVAGAGCPPVAAAVGSVDLAAVAPAVPGWTPEQVQNAATVIRAGQALGVPGRGLVIGVMTAMGESALLVVDHGDAAGPDSRGLFQQRDNGAWGTYADRMDPMTSATAFFRALLAVPDWEQLPPTIAAHRTQHNADPWHYARWWDAALALAGVVVGAPVPGIAPGTGAVACTAASPILRAAQGAWTSPADGPLTSGFGVRPNPTGDGSQLHAGIDLAPGCGAPIVAAGPGTVVRAGPASGYGNLVVVDHGGGVLTRYGHMTDDGIVVAVGQPVVAGQQLARVGSAGDSTGCHLHLEVLLDGAQVDPVGFLAARGVGWSG